MNTELFQRGSLTITPMDDGWGFQWPNSALMGPYITPNNALMAAFRDADDRISVHRTEQLRRLAAQATPSLEARQPYELEAKPSYEAESDEFPAITAIQTLCAALATMRETPLGDINDPDSGTAFGKALLAASNGYGTLDVLLKQWNNELTRQHEREQRAYRRLMEMD